MPHSGHSPSGKASTSLVAALFHSVWDSNPLILGSNRAIGFRHVLPRAATKWSGSPGARFASRPAPSQRVGDGTKCRMVPGSMGGQWMALPPDPSLPT